MQSLVSMVETKPVKQVKYCLLGSPDVGLVGAIAVSYVIQTLKMEAVASLDSDILPPLIVIHKGAPQGPFRAYLKNDLAALISEIPVEPHTIAPVARAIVEWVQSKEAEALISISGVPVENRLDIDVPKVYGVGTSPKMLEIFSKGDIEPLEEGFMAGLHAVVMRECLKKGVNNIVLLAQSHLQYPDPGAAASTVTSLNNMINLGVDVKKLLDQEEEIRLKMRELMQRTRRSMSQIPKSSEQEIPMMYV
ncbi:MAG: PAC2 family protein [Candidatus Bathyarchaeia archaeon]